jgi:predicted peptidase
MFFLLCILGGCTSNPKPGKQVLIDRKLANTKIDSYWLYLPQKYDQNRSWPVILFLTGGGGVNFDPYSAQKEGPVNFLIETGLDDHLSLDEFIVINPHMEPGPESQRQWYHHSTELIEILDGVVSEFNGDKNRLYLTGLSHGGHGSWGLAKRYPDKFAALVPIAGRLSCKDRCDKLEMPIWVMHSRYDPLVDYGYSESAIANLEQAQGIKFSPMGFSRMVLEQPYIFTTFDEAQHNIWDHAYSQPILYEWLLTQRKQ